MRTLRDVIDYWIEGLFPLFLLALILGGIASLIWLGIEYPIAFMSIFIVVVAPVILGVINTTIGGKNDE